MSDCRHDTIVTWGTQDNRLWACAFCSRRFYPACETCVDVGHRNETHPAAPQPDTALPEVPASEWYRQGYEAGRKAQPDTTLTDRMRSAIDALLDYGDHSGDCRAVATKKHADCDCGWPEEEAVATALLTEHDQVRALGEGAEEGVDRA